jgi:signal transduction histidine kinase
VLAATDEDRVEEQVALVDEARGDRLAGELRLDLGLIREHLAAGETSEAAKLLETVEADLSQATAELRELARGLHPGILTRSRLQAAIQALIVRAPFLVDLSVEPGPRPPQATEAAAYFVVAESLTNAARHAGASRMQVELRRDNGWLGVTIADDGRGGASLDGGSGLIGLRDRVAALGGDFDLESPAGDGTRLGVRLPLGGPA